MGLSLHPEDAISGGLFEEGVYRITDAHFLEWDYDKPEGGNVGFGLMVNLTNAESGKTDKKFWSVGASTLWSTTEDGQELLPLGTTRGVRESCNFMQLMGSLLEAGYPTEKLKTDRVGDIYNGLLVHLINKKAPSREGMEPREVRLNPQTGQPYPQRDPEVVVVAQIKEFPWDASKEIREGILEAAILGPQGRPSGGASSGGRATGPGSRGGARQAPAAQAQDQAAPPADINGHSDPADVPAPGSEDPADATLGLIYEAIANKGGEAVSRDDISKLAMQRFARTKLLPQVMGLLVNKAQFSAWERDGVLSLSEGGTKVGMPG